MNRTAAMIGLAISLTLHSGLLLFSSNPSLPVAVAPLRITLQPIQAATADSEQVLPRAAKNRESLQTDPAPRVHDQTTSNAEQPLRKPLQPSTPQPVHAPQPNRETTSMLPESPPPPVTEIASEPPTPDKVTPTVASTTEKPLDSKPPAPAAIAASINADRQKQFADARSVEISPPAYIPSPRPYPPIAKQRGWEGIVTLQALIGAKGDVKQVELQQSSGYPVLDRAALKHIRKSRFHPALKAGQPVEMTVRVPVVFELK